jgi:hypothetical protein
MKERPILFNGEMVRAILAGRKTQTRRPVKLNDGRFVCSRSRNYLTVCEMRDGVGPWWHPHGGHPGEPLPSDHVGAACPFGQVGDRLWVRETWGRFPSPDAHVEIGYRADGTEDDSGEREGWWLSCFFYPGKVRWRPSIHMPRWASRITLEITGVRVERLQEISHEDAAAEEIVPGEYALREQRLTINQIAFSHLWDGIYGDGPFAWDANPWVWVVEFKRVEQ